MVVRRQQRHQFKTKRPTSAARTSPGAVLQACAVENIDIAIKALEAPGRTQERSLHRTRRALRRLIAIISLVVKPMSLRGEYVLAMAKAACHTLSPIRDADAVIKAIDRKRKRRQSRSRAVEFTKLRRQLARNRAQVLRRVLKNDPQLKNLLKKLQNLRCDLLELPWGRITSDELACALRRSLRRAESAERKARKRKSVKARHRWRRRSRTLLYQLEAVDTVLIRRRQFCAKKGYVEKLGQCVKSMGRERDAWLLDRISLSGPGSCVSGGPEGN